MPDVLPGGLDHRVGFELCQQKRRQQIGRQIAGTDIHPGVFIHLPPKKAAAIGAFLADNFGLLHILRVVDQQRAAFAALEIFSFVKALRRHLPERT